jgi:histidinol-phosphate aminotransferase
MSELIDQWVRPEIRALSAYHVPDSSGLIKLDAMENPYRLPDELRAGWLESLAEAQLNRYPDPQADKLKSRLRASTGIADDAGLILGNGSDELIQMLAMTVAGEGRTLLTVEPGFVMYRMIATFCNLPYQAVPLNAGNFDLDLPALLKAVEIYQPALLFLAYPNNPTGNLFPESALLELIHATPGLVVIDEAYAPFTDHTFINRAGEFDNLLVMRTLSKMGLAGLRLGYLAGPTDLIHEIDKTRLPYNINVLTQISTQFALAHESVFNQQTRQIRQERDRLYRQLEQTDGIRPFPSEANFILLRCETHPAQQLFEELKTQGILVKLLHGAHPQLEQCLRVTVGTPDENQAFVRTIKRSLDLLNES